MYLSAVAGFVLLFGGGEFLVRGAVQVSRRLGLSPLLIGMTVVAWCTSAPELVVSLGAALEGHSDIAVGNVVGSNIFNILGVLGIAAVISPMLVDPRALRRDTAAMVASALALALVAMTGEIGRAPGVLLLVGLALYVVFSYRSEVRRPSLPSASLHEHESAEIRVTGPAMSGIVYLLIGLVALVIGSQSLMSGASEIARTFGVPEAVIGLSLVAVGTSLPELATSIIAALRRHPDVAVGNVVGSNIFNILGILGITALIRPVGVAEQIASIDVWVMVGASLLMVPLLLWKGRVGRFVGVFLSIAYVAYLVALF
ncbi:MAG: calcium/sodium antiporter [Coriobacteriia bacterium]|nr:calcium/sodium antiporter [Coriobacteriia bacterium]MBN2839509.1 calcium/sodium antiporter [Coriobacteriia bacterium]